MGAGHLLGTARHRYPVGLRRRQRDAGRNSQQRHRHGNHAENDKAAMKRFPHVTTVPQSSPHHKIPAIIAYRPPDIGIPSNHYND
jgi:hypothetical protein